MVDIKAEHDVIVNAPPIPLIIGAITRCHFCGQIITASVGAKEIHEAGIVRIMGGCCGAK